MFDKGVLVMSGSPNDVLDKNEEVLNTLDSSEENVSPMVATDFLL